MLNSAIDQLGPPDSELTPNSIMTDLTEHYVPNSVTRVREHKSVSHVPNISILKRGTAPKKPRCFLAPRPAGPAAAAPRPGSRAGGRARLAPAQVASSRRRRPAPPRPNLDPPAALVEDLHRPSWLAFVG